MFFSVATRANKTIGTMKVYSNKIFSVYKWRDVPADQRANRINERDSLETKICHIASQTKSRSSITTCYSLNTPLQIHQACRGYWLIYITIQSGPSVHVLLRSVCEMKIIDMTDMFFTEDTRQDNFTCTSVETRSFSMLLCREHQIKTSR